jgi:signal transduction histidine kinase
MRTSLRWKILLLAVLTPLVLGLATVVTVHRNVKQHVDSSSIHESLEHSASVFESMLNTRSRALAGGARVVVQDPRFFSLLMLNGPQRDSRFTATVKGMARDFSAITRTDIFEVLDRRGSLLASVGGSSTRREIREPLVRRALAGEAAEGLLVESHAYYQAVATPVYADGRVIGVLLLGAQVGGALAHELKSEMQCEVTFLTGTVVTGTTLSATGDLAAMSRLVKTVDLERTPDLKTLGVLKVKAARTVYLTLVRRIPGAAPGGTQLYVMQRSFDPETSFQTVMQRDMVLLAVIAVLVALITGWLLSDQIVRPLNALVRGAQAMETGDYSHPLQVLRRDEIGYLVERFMEMRKRERAYVNSLEQVAKMKSQFISVASHELRTPISVLASYCDLLSGGSLGAIAPKQQEALGIMRGFITRLTRIAEDATQMAQVQGERLVLNVQPCAVESMVQQAVGAAIAQRRQRPVRVALTCDPFVGPILVDERVLSVAITHLVTNAIRFTQDGGEVQVHVTEAAGRLRIQVRDRGVGIAADKLESLLTHGVPVGAALDHRSSDGLDFKSAGLGLGLGIARAVVEAHDGVLLANSREGEGSIFALELPLVYADGRRAAA